jgi:modification methylase
MNNSHPAPFPVNLVNRIISSTRANIILDPFMGSGTTAIAAIINGRKYIGIEIAPQYVALAESRINDYYKSNELLEYKSNKFFEKKETHYEFI